MPHLISLEEHNKAIVNSVHDWHNNEARPNGIACPRCGAELLDSNPNMVCASLPPQKAIRCSKCVYSGFRLA